MYTEAHIQEGIKRMDIIVADQMAKIVKLQKTKAENSNTDTTVLDMKISDEEYFLKALREAREMSIERLKTLNNGQKKKDRGTKRKKEPESNEVSKKKKEDEQEIIEEETIEEDEDPRGVPPARGFMWSDKKQKWVFPKDY